MTLTITADTTFTSGATMETLSFGDLVVGMLVEVTTSGDATDGYTALTIQTLAAQPTEDTIDSVIGMKTFFSSNVERMRVPHRFRRSVTPLNPFSKPSVIPLVR